MAEQQNQLSRIKNPLDDFQSYSVHYILLACRTTVVASAFADEKNDTTSLAAIDNTKALGDPVVFGNSSSDVFLVIDTRRFAQFSVENLKYDVYVNGLQQGGSTSNLAADLSMTVLDSVGISFANFLQWLMDSQMKTNFDGLVFMLRTIFVGHKADGTTETVQSETIPMHLNRVEINLDYAKGAYTMEFMPNMNFNVQKHSRFLVVSTTTAYGTGDGNTLGGLVTSFEKRLNDASLKFFNDIQKAVKDAGGGTGDGQYGRRVEYQITIPESWKPWQVKGSNQGKVSETKYGKDSTTPPTTINNSLVATQPGSEITKILDEIFKQIPDIAEMGNFKSSDPSKEGVITFYKYIVGLTSSNETVCVHVDVVEFKVPNVFRRKPSESAAVSSIDTEFYAEQTDKDTGIKRRVPKDFIEYDYIFTGRNKDILNFDMKIQDFQFLLASNLKIGPSDLNNAADSGETPDGKGKETYDDLLHARKYDPIVLPIDSNAALKAFSNVAGAIGKKDEDTTKKQQQYTQNLSMFYAGSPIITTLTIKGNPLIMHKFNVGKLLGHPSGGGQTSSEGSTTGIVSREAYRKDLEDRILKANPKLEKQGNSFVVKSNLSEKSYAVSPVFVRVNVKGPAVDFRTNEDKSPPYASSVLENQYYVVFKVSNVFQGHMFTQELELYSHNVYGASGTDKVKNT